MHSPAGGASRFSRSPGRSGPSPYSSGFRPRYGSGFHTSRSRSPLGFRRAASYSRFSRNATAGSDYQTYPPHAARGSQQQPFNARAPSPGSTTNDTQPAVAVGSSTSVQSAGGKALAPGWRTAYTADGTPYYYHETTKKTQWEAPLAEPDRAIAATDETDRALPLAATAAVAPEPMAAQPMDQLRALSAAGDATVPMAGISDSRMPVESGRWPPAAAAPASRSFTSVAVTSAVCVPMAASGAATPAVVQEEKVDGFSKSRVDEIIERTMRLGNPSSSTASLPQLPGSTASNGAGSMQQLVTPDTDGEPSGSAAHQSKSLAGSSSLRKHSTPSSLSGSPSTGPGGPARREKLEKKATAELAAYVVRQMNKYKSQMGHDEFKHEARKITKILMEKERKLPGFDPMKLIGLSAHKKAKVKQFVSEYMVRLVGRRVSSLGSAAGSPAGPAAGQTPPGPPFTPANN
ncbi:histone methyltransferase set2 [Linderina pennispora]|nr:histone methyltransferase set2 [Linderina pennispora]